MNAFRQYRAARDTQGVKVLPPRQTDTAWDVGVPGSYRDALDAFLAQRRSRTPSFISYDKIALAQNYAGALYLPISFAARQFSRSKLTIYRHADDERDQDGKVQVPYSQRSLYRMFSTHPNPNDTFADILYSFSQQYDICGEGYLWMPPVDSRTGEVSEFGEPVECYVIPSAWVSGLPSCPWWEGGAYQVTPYVSQYPGSTQAAFIPAEQMVRIYDPHPLFDKTAYSVLQALSQCIDTVRAIDQSRASTQEQGCQQNLALEMDPQLINMQSVDIKRAREIFQQINAGARNAGKALFLPPGVKANRIATAPDDMAWQEGWSQLTDHLWAAFHTNRSALGLNAEVNYATLYASVKQLYWSKLQPRTEQVAGRLSKDYFGEYIGEDYFCELTLPPMDDEALTLQGLDRDLRAGAITIAEYRHKRGYPVDPQKMPWLAERAWAAGKPTEENPENPQEKDPAVEASRPRNAQAEGALGSRIDEGKLLGVLDNALVRGTILNGKH